MDVLRTTRTQSDVGGSNESHLTRYRNVPCHRRQLNATERDLLGREGVVATHRVYCSAEYDEIEEDDVLRITTGEVGTGSHEDWDVVRIHDPHEMGHHLEIDAVRRV
jgi:hypothetical protein